MRNRRHRPLLPTVASHRRQGLTTYRGVVIDDGVPGDSVPDEPDRAVVWGDEQPVIPNSGGPPPSEPVGDPGEVTAGESLASDTTSSPLVALTRDIWGETTSGGGTTDLELGDLLMDVEEGLAAQET